MNDFSKNLDLPNGIYQIGDLPDAKLGVLWATDTLKHTAS